MNFPPDFLDWAGRNVDNFDRRTGAYTGGSIPAKYQGITDQIVQNNDYKSSFLGLLPLLFLFSLYRRPYYAYRRRYPPYYPRRRRRRRRIRRRRRR